MNRRIFLSLLSLPFVAPAARIAERVRASVRQPLWYLNVHMTADAPVEILVNDRPRYVVAPAHVFGPVQPVQVPMYYPRPKTIKLSLRTNGTMYLYSASIKFRA